MKGKDILGKGKEFYTNPGDPIHIIYAPVVGKEGSIELVPSGKENTDDYIQSFAESTDIRIILNRVAQGEVELLSKTAGSYGDFTQAPKTLAEALQLQMDSNRLFQALPVETRRKFDDDPNKFFAAAGTDDWFNKIADVLPEQMRSMNNTPSAQTEKAAESPTTE